MPSIFLSFNLLCASLMLRMELCSPSYYSLTRETAGIIGGPDHPNSDALHDLSLLMSVRHAGEMPLPLELFTKEQICRISHLPAHALLLTVSILNGYESLLEFASDSDITQIAQNLVKVYVGMRYPSP